MLETALLHTMRRRKVLLALLLLALPYVFAGTVSTFLHDHDHSASLYDPQCPSCNYQKLVQDANADAEPARLLPSPQQAHQDLALPDAPAGEESTFRLDHAIRAPPA